MIGTGIIYMSLKIKELRKQPHTRRSLKTKELPVDNLWITPCVLQKLKNCSLKNEVGL